MLYKRVPLLANEAHKWRFFSALKRFKNYKENIFWELRDKKKRKEFVYLMKQRSLLRILDDYPFIVLCFDVL